VDVRIVCATHMDLPALIKEGDFREDLYYRINETTIVVPPLREREGDAVVLARAFLEAFALEHKRPIKGFTQRALEMIDQYEWPGNVRELENRVKRAVIMADNTEISETDLELHDIKVIPHPFNLREVRDAAEKQALSRALTYTAGNISRTAELLGVTRPTLYNLLKKFDTTS